MQSNKPADDEHEHKAVVVDVESGQKKEAAEIGSLFPFYN